MPLFRGRRAPPGTPSVVSFHRHVRGASRRLHVRERLAAPAGHSRTSFDAAECSTDGSPRVAATPRADPSYPFAGRRGLRRVNDEREGGRLDRMRAPHVNAMRGRRPEIRTTFGCHRHQRCSYPRNVRFSRPPRSPSGLEASRVSRRLARFCGSTPAPPGVFFTGSGRGGFGAASRAAVEPASDAPVTVRRRSRSLGSDPVRIARPRPLVSHARERVGPLRPGAPRLERAVARLRAPGRRAPVGVRHHPGTLSRGSEAGVDLVAAFAHDPTPDVASPSGGLPRGGQRLEHPRWSPEGRLRTTSSIELVQRRTMRGHTKSNAVDPAPPWHPVGARRPLPGAPSRGTAAAGVRADRTLAGASATNGREGTSRGGSSRRTSEPRLGRARTPHGHRRPLAGRWKATRRARTDRGLTVGVESAKTRRATEGPRRFSSWT